jgi:hypothetical protein
VLTGRVAYICGIGCGSGGGTLPDRSPFLPEKKSECIITGGAFAGVMTRIIQSFSVPDGSVAHAKLKEWKDNGVNISAVIQMLLEEDGGKVDHIENLKQKIRRLKELTKNTGSRSTPMTQEQWDIEFGMW